MLSSLRWYGKYIITQIWSKRYQVTPFATRQLSLNQIIGDQVKHDNGNTLDPRYREGVVAWSTANAAEGKGRLLLSNRGSAMARNFSCYTTEVVCAVNLEVYDYGLIPIDGYADYADSLPVYCYPAQQGNCSNGTQASGGGATFSWTLGNTSIVNFNTPSDQTSQNPNLRGIAAGTTSAYSTGYLNGCYVQGGGNPPPEVVSVKIAGPSMVLIHSSIQLTATGTPAGGTYSWSSSNGDVTLTNNTAATVTVLGASAGAASLTVTYIQDGVKVTAAQVVTVPPAIPTNFRVDTVTSDASGDLNWTYYWDSSTGKDSDLSQCTVREYVTYPGAGGFNWPSPPYDTSGNPTANPTIGTSPGVNAAVIDHQLHPGFLKPYVANSFSATQISNSVAPITWGAWQPLSPTYTIVRSVSNSGSVWTYQVAKDGHYASVQLP